MNNVGNNKVTFYYNPMSRGRIVHWLLEELGADYEIKHLDWAKADHKSPEYLKINPMGKIPAIVHKGVVVTETPAICLYLADAFPAAGLAPQFNDPLRGTYYRWFMFAVGCVEPALLDKENPHKNPLDPRGCSYGTLQDTMNTFEKLLENGYVVGNKFSAADVYISALIGWKLMSKVLEPRPVFERYLKICTDRPAYQRFMEKAGPIPSPA